MDWSCSETRRTSNRPCAGAVQTGTGVAGDARRRPGCTADRRTPLICGAAPSTVTFAVQSVGSRRSALKPFRILCQRRTTEGGYDHGTDQDQGFKCKPGGAKKERPRDIEEDPGWRGMGSDECILPRRRSNERRLCRGVLSPNSCELLASWGNDSLLKPLSGLKAVSRGVQSKGPDGREIAGLP
jgi:hypothetical protein